MSKYKVKYMYGDGTEEFEDELYDTEEAAMEAGSYGVSCAAEGAEILHMSNPGDYPDEEADVDFEVVEIDE